MRRLTRKTVLTAHIVSSVGWAGALAVLFAHAVVNWSSQDFGLVQATAIAMAITTWYVILPLSLTSFSTGVVQALTTPWGLVRHYWIVFKLLFTAVATGVLLLKLKAIDLLAEAANGAGFAVGAHEGLRTSLVLHAGGGLVVLLGVTCLAVFKPAGLTPWVSHDRPSRLPGWVKWTFVASAGALMLLFLMLVGGGHGPSAHVN